MSTQPPNNFHFGSKGGGSSAPHPDEKPVATTERCQTTVLVEIKGSPSGFGQLGNEAASWRIVDGKHSQVFGPNGSGHVGTAAPGTDPSVHSELAANTSSMKRANILSADLLQYQSSFPFPLGVTVSCLPKTECVDTGERYTFTTLPNTAVTTCQSLFKAGPEKMEANEWNKTYSQFNSQNLETQGVLTLQNCPYVFVNENHPVINLLRMNKSVLGVDIDDVPKMDGEWYKLARPLMSSCCDTIRTNIIGRFQDTQADLSQMCVQLHRIGDVPWQHVDAVDAMQTFVPDPRMSTEAGNQAFQDHLASVKSKPGVLLARIRLEYELPAGV